MKAPKNEKKISAKQQEILEYIDEWITTNGYPPTIREICDALGLKSTSTVFCHLQTLEKAGKIKRDQTKPRAMEILDEEILARRKEKAMNLDGAGLDDCRAIPVVGQVAAGQPILAVENIREYVPLPASYIPEGKLFILQVKGESMIKAGILNGDYLLVKQTEEAANGTIVVALVDDSATVKTFYREAKRIRLQPENEYLDPIYVEKDTPFRILGVVKGVFRFFQQTN